MNILRISAIKIRFYDFESLFIGHIVAIMVYIDTGGGKIRIAILHNLNFIINFALSREKEFGLK